MEYPGQHEYAPPAANRAVKLPPFWTANPAILCVQTDSTPPRRVKLPSGIQRYPPRPIILHTMAETCSSAHSARAASAGAASVGAANAGAASAGAASVGAASAGPTCSRVAEQGASPFPPAAVCRWCHHLLFNMQQSGRAGCKSLPTCSGVPMVPPPSLQHCTFSAETCPPRTRGLPQRIKAFPSEPMALPASLSVRTRTRRWRALPHRRSANPKPNPNPAVACVSAPPVSEPEADFLRRWRGLPRRRPV